jgi:hypothetical protein
MLFHFQKFKPEFFIEWKAPHISKREVTISDWRGKPILGRPGSKNKGSNFQRLCAVCRVLLAHRTGKLICREHDTLFDDQRYEAHVR